MKITDPAHAVRVLKSLVEYGDDPGIFAFAMEHGSVEGAKAMLKDWNEVEHDSEYVNGYRSLYKNAVCEGVKKALLSQAQAYAPRMAEAGMKVPE